MAVTEEKGQDLSEDPRFAKFKQQWELEKDPRYRNFKKQWENKPPSLGETAKDVGKQVAVGGVTGLLGLPGDVLQLVSMIPGMGWVKNANSYIPTTEGVTEKIEKHTGWDLTPKTKAGRIARSGGEVAGSLVVPGGVAARGVKSAGGLAKVLGKTAARGATAGALGQTVGEATNSELAQAGTTLLTSGKLPGKVLSKVSKGAVKTLQTGKLPPKTPNVKGYKEIDRLAVNATDKGAINVAKQAGVTPDEAKYVFQPNWKQATFNSTASKKQRIAAAESRARVEGKVDLFAEKTGREMKARGPIPEKHAPTFAKEIEHTKRRINKLPIRQEVRKRATQMMDNAKREFVSGEGKKAAFTERGSNPEKMFARNREMFDTIKPHTAEEKEMFKLMQQPFNRMYGTYGKGLQNNVNNIMSMEEKLLSSSGIGQENYLSKAVKRSTHFGVAVGVATGNPLKVVKHLLVKSGITKGVASIAINSPRGKVLMRDATKALAEGDKARLATIVQSLKRLGEERSKENDKKK